MIIEQFINNGTLRSEHFSIIIKSLLLLDQPIWAQENIVTVRSLLLLCCGITNQLADSQISVLQKVRLFKNLLNYFNCYVFLVYITQIFEFI